MIEVGLAEWNGIWDIRVEGVSRFTGRDDWSLSDVLAWLEMYFGEDWRENVKLYAANESAAAILGMGEWREA